MKFSNRSRKIMGLLAVISMIFIYYAQINDCDSYPSTNVQIERKIKQQTGKWIVITTINYPTDAVKALANQPGWRVVVVADKKTPIDWNLTNIDFLSVERQKEMNFTVSSLIPYNSYTRKMIGYLYAIKKGAQWIYDTDDDNQPIGVGIQLFDTQPYVTGLSYGKECRNDCNTKKPLFNPYAFWGQPNIWPRGYPLEEVRKENDETLLTLCKKQRVPAIQQGLVLKDPDVDAVFRLLNADETTGLDVQFNKHAPPIILNAGSFCPFNSQNTMFHYDAFWSLFLPISVAFRVTDIWRGYFAQKLLHLTGNRLGFYPVNAIQKRNPHSYLADFKDEIQLYAEAGKMVEFISKWACDLESFQDCMRKLSRDFLKDNFWNEDDVRLIDAWITDLDRVGYIFPSLPNINQQKCNEIELNPSSECRNAALHFPVIKSKSAEIHKNFDDIKDWCNEALPVNESIRSCFNEKKYTDNGLLKKLSRIALIVTGNYPFGPSISVMQRLYGNFFATVIFCGPIDPLKIVKSDGYMPLLNYNYIHMTEEEISKGYRAYICTAKAIELRLQSIEGYLTIADDTQFNFWNDFDYSRFRLNGVKWAPGGGWWWNEANVGRNAMKRAVELIETRTRLNPTSALAKAFSEYTKAVGGDGFSVLLTEGVSSVSDFYYLPKENETVFYEMSEVFFEANLFHEIAVPKIAAGLQWFKYYNSTTTDIAKFAHIWFKDRLNWETFYKKDMIYLHPIKLSYVNEVEVRRKYLKRAPANMTIVDSKSLSAVASSTLSTSRPGSSFFHQFRQSQ